MDDIEVDESSVAIVGWEEGSAGQVHSWIHEAHGLNVVCFVNPSEEMPSIERKARPSKLFEYPESNSFRNVPLVSAANWPALLLKHGISNVLVTTSCQQERLEQIAAAKKHGLRLVSAIHPTSTILPEAVVGSNVIVHAGAVIGYRAEVEDGVIVNVGSQVDHHCVIEPCVNIDPGVVLAGNVTVRKLAHIHTGTTIINKIEVEEGAIIGAGAVVIRNIPPHVTAVGVPAKALEKH